MRVIELKKLLHEYSPICDIEFRLQDETLYVEDRAVDIVITEENDEAIFFGTTLPVLHFHYHPAEKNLTFFPLKSLHENDAMRNSIESVLALAQEAVNENFFHEKYSYEDAQREIRGSRRNMNAIDTIRTRLKQAKLEGSQIIIHHPQEEEVI